MKKKAKKAAKAQKKTPKKKKASLTDVYESAQTPSMQKIRTRK